MTVAITDCRMPTAAKRRLEALGFPVVEARPYTRLSEPVSAHPDMLMFYHGGVLISSADYCDTAPYIFEDLSRLIPSLKITFTQDLPKASYPDDAIFNALIAEGRLFCKTDTVSEAIKNYALSTGLELISVKQGYPACTALSLGGGIAITADGGMAKSLRAVGVNVTLIENGDISLPPYDYGFIGGTAGMHGDKVYFIGDIRTHKSYEKISHALALAGKTPVTLYDGELLDLGRILFVDGGV